MLAFASAPLPGAMILLYDGSGLPSSQPWLSFASDGILSGGAAQQTTTVDGVRLQTDSVVKAGYSNFSPFSVLKNPLFPTLNRNNGFELSFSLAIASENHVSNDRAGFSVILLGSDAKGIELGFWGNEIWAQASSPLFQHAEGVAVDTSTRRNYRLQILDNTYGLFDGASSLLSGAVRDYSAFGSPYTLSNFLFLGDDTTSGAADISLGSVALQSDLSVVPEPSSLVLVSAGLWLGLFRVARSSRIRFPA